MSEWQVTGFEGASLTVFWHAVQEVIFEGKAAVPLAALTGRFQKGFFLQPGSYELYGRVRVRPGALGDRLFPGYFKCTPKSTIIPGKLLPFRPGAPMHSHRNWATWDPCLRLVRFIT